MFRYYIKIFLYQFTRRKKILDMYMKAIRNLEQMSESEWARFKDLAEHRKEIYKKYDK